MGELSVVAFFIMKYHSWAHPLDLAKTHSHRRPVFWNVIEGKLLLVGVSHILGLGVCAIVGVTGSYAPWDAKSGVDRRLFVSLASVYLRTKTSTILTYTFSYYPFHLLVLVRPTPTLMGLIPGGISFSRPARI